MKCKSFADAFLDQTCGYKQAKIGKQMNTVQIYRSKIYYSEN